MGCPGPLAAITYAKRKWGRLGRFVGTAALFRVKLRRCHRTVFLLTLNGFDGPYCRSACGTRYQSSATTCESNVTTSLPTWSGGRAGFQPNSSTAFGWTRSKNAGRAWSLSTNSGLVCPRSVVFPPVSTGRLEQARVMSGSVEGVIVRPCRFSPFVSSLALNERVPFLYRSAHSRPQSRTGYKSMHRWDLTEDTQSPKPLNPTSGRPPPWSGRFSPTSGLGQSGDRT